MAEILAEGRTSFAEVDIKVTSLAGNVVVTATIEPQSGDPVVVSTDSVVMQGANLSKLMDALRKWT